MMLKLNLLPQLFSFYPPLCFKFDKIIKWFNFKVISKPVNKFNFPSIKSAIPEFCKWGTYKVLCKDYNLFYIGLIKRDLETHLKNIYDA